jgi:hypothetical protein
MSDEHILFISAGASIDKTYSVTVEELKPTHVVVLAEESIFHDYEKDTDFLKEEKPKIRLAIEGVRQRVELDGRREFSLVHLPRLDQDIIRGTILKIRNDHKEAQFSFNVTGGTALFSTSLFLMAIWLGGRVCITRTKDPFIELRIPKMSLKELEENPDLMKIIRILGGESKNKIRMNDKDDTRNKSSRMNDTWIRNKEILRELDVIKSVSERVGKNEQVNQTRDMKKLISWNLVEEKKEGRESFYRLTSDGIFAHNIFKEQ